MRITGPNSRRIKTLALVAATGLGLAACGGTVEEQVLLGGAAGVLAADRYEVHPVVGFIAGASGNVAYCQANPGRCQ